MRNSELVRDRLIAQECVAVPAAAACKPELIPLADNGPLPGTHRKPARLSRNAQPPLTTAGLASYAGVLASIEVTVEGTLPSGKTTGTITYFVVDTTKNAIVSQVVLPNAAQQNNSVAISVKVPSSTGSFAVGTFNASGNFEPASFLAVNNPAAGPRPTGALGR